MPIQFLCPNCKQPIEVDDEHAGKAAACPYCRAVITVPSGSTYGAEGMPTGRPVAPSGAPAQPQPPGGPYVPPLPGIDPARPARARKLGIAGLVCLGLVLLLQIVTNLTAPQGFNEDIRRVLEASSQPADPQQVQEELTKFVSAHQGLFAGGCASLLLLLAALVLGIVSVSISRRRNWPGWVTLVGSIALVFLSCCGSCLLAA